MTIHEVENLSFAELKKQREEIIKALADAKPADLAARYLQARTDAKQRDEKLAEQGATIANLNAALDAERAKSQQLDMALGVRTTEADLARKDAERLGNELKAQAFRAEKAETLAKARRAVLAELMAKVAPLLAAE